MNTNTKKRLFDRGLYLEALRQLRMIGIMAIILMLILALSSPISALVNKATEEQTIQGIEYYITNPMIVLSFIILAPLLTLSIFSFMNKRNASDFYHAIPISRLAIFFSMFAAVVTWFTLALVISNGAALLVWNTLVSHYAINIKGALITIFNIWAGSVMVAGAVAIAMCITGTTFTNFVVSLLIIFFPRLLTTVFVTTLNNALWITQGLPFIPLVDGRYNVVTNLILGIFAGYTYPATFTYIWGGVYTLVLGLIYTLLAAYLFYQRKSESAEKSAPNQVLQTVYRLCCAMVVCLIPCVLILRRLLNPQFRASNDYYVAIVILYLIAVVIYFIYELITTRKWKRVAQSIPALGILIIMNVAFIGGIVGLYYRTLNIVPSAEEILAVRRVRNTTYGFVDAEHKNYFGMQEETIRLTDREVTTLVAEQLAKTVTTIKEQGAPYSYYPGYTDKEPEIAVSFAIETKHKTFYRQILITRQQFDLLTTKITEHPEYRKLYTQLPKPGQNGTKVTIERLLEQDAEEVYNAIVAEVPTVDLDKWFTHMSQYADGRPSYDTTGLPMVTVVTNYGSETATFQFHIPDLLPKSLSLYIEKVNQGTTISNILKEMRRFRNWGEMDNMAIYFFNLDLPVELKSGLHFSGHAMYPVSTESPADTLSKLADILEPTSTNKVDVHKPFVFILWTYPSQDETDRMLGSPVPYGVRGQSACYLPYPEDVPFPEELTTPFQP